MPLPCSPLLHPHLAPHRMPAFRLGTALGRALPMHAACTATTPRPLTPHHMLYFRLGRGPRGRVLGRVKLILLVSPVPRARRSGCL
eukprot:scaffold139657_cov148-Phaeocystis_antarctica.AAC.1